MATITESIKAEVKEIVYNFFAEECETDVSRITNDTNIISAGRWNMEQWFNHNIEQLDHLGKLCHFCK